MTWPFGGIHQCKVFVHYRNPYAPLERERVGVRLPPGRTRAEAMQRGLDWVAVYKGPDSPDDLFAKLYLRWKGLYRTRVDVLSHLFFTNGNGYSWLEGAIVPTYEDDSPRERVRTVAPEGSPEYLSDEYFKLPSDQQRLIAGAFYDAKDDALPVGPVADDGEPRNFYPVCGYALIACIPDDVRPDWLAVAYEGRSDAPRSTDAPSAREGAVRSPRGRTSEGRLVCGRGRTGPM